MSISILSSSGTKLISLHCRARVISDPAEKIHTNEIVGLKKVYMSPEQENEKSMESLLTSGSSGEQHDNLMGSSGGSQVRKLIQLCCRHYAAGARRQLQRRQSFLWPEGRLVQ